MRCEICHAPTRHAFTKTFNECSLGAVDYWRCDGCGFVLSRTHAEMSPTAWGDLNRLCHEKYQGTSENLLDPKWKQRLAAQARMLSDLAQAGLLDPAGRWVDYGCGDGDLSEVVARESGLRLLKYDKYMAAGDDYLAPSDVAAGGFDFVLSTSVFEHMTRRVQWDEVEALVTPTGALGIHTLVAETVPNDPTWFYLEPPHCAFFSNAAMTRLFEDWGYRASVYSVEASLWVWFRSDPSEIENKVTKLNAMSTRPILFKAGFLDYWKTDPRARRA